MADNDNNTMENASTTVEDFSAAVDVRTLNKYDFMDYTFGGSHGYINHTYLVPHKKESFYNIRRQSSFYKNFFKPIVEAMIDPVFDEPIVRECDSENFKKFIKNADNCGTTLQTIVNNAMYPAQYSGLTFIVVDNFMPEAMPQTQRDATANRIFPYIYQKKVQDVFSHSADNYGNITSITFFDCCVKSADGKKEIKQYRRWDNMTWTVLRDMQGTATTEKELTEKELTVISSGSHNLGVVPVVPVNDFTTSCNLKEFPMPPLWALAWLNYSLYNLESEIRAHSQAQCFSTLVIQGDMIKSIITGLRNFLRMPIGATVPPQYVSPLPQHFNNLMDYADRMRKDLYMLAAQAGVTGVADAKSGIAKEWDFRAQESVLKCTAMAASGLEIKIADIFKLYTKEAFEYSPVYPEQFNPTYTADMIKQILDIQDKMPPKPLADELWKTLAQLEYKNDEEKLDAITEAMDMDAQAADMARKAALEGMTAGGGDGGAEPGDGQGQSDSGAAA